MPAIPVRRDGDKGPILARFHGGDDPATLRRYDLEMSEEEARELAGALLRAIGEKDA